MRYEHKGNARKAKITADITGTDLTIPADDLSGWADGSIGPFWAVLNKDTVSEEKVLLASRSNNTLTVYSDVGGNGRGKDGTTAQAHQAGTTIEHIWTATEADEANAHVNEGSGAHGYPASNDLVTLSGAQTITGVKTMNSPDLQTPNVVDPTVQDGTWTGATHISSHKITLVGNQEEGEFRVRDIMLSTADPTPADGSDGDVWMKYV